MSGAVNQRGDLPAGIWVMEYFLPGSGGWEWPHTQAGGLTGRAAPLKRPTRQSSPEDHDMRCVLESTTQALSSGNRSPLTLLFDAGSVSAAATLNTGIDSL